MEFTSVKSFRREIEYQMPKEMADDLLSDRKGKERKVDPQKFLCDYVNDQMGLIGRCTKVTVR